MTSFSLFNPPANEALGFMPRVPNQHESAACLLGIYPGSSTFWSAYYNSTTSQDSLLFRKYSMMFSVTRTRCNATWIISKTSIKLASGSCADRKRDHITVATDVLGEPLLYPYPLDTLPVLSKTIGDLKKEHPDSPWTMPKYASSVVMSYWARAAFMLGGDIKTKFSDILYIHESEKIISIRATLKPHAALYFILTIQPALAIFAFVVGRFLYKIPIERGFGAASILPGIDSETPGELQQTALSGKPIRSMRVDVHIDPNPAPGITRAQYSLVPSDGKRDQIYRSTTK